MSDDKGNLLTRGLKWTFKAATIGSVLAVASYALWHGAAAAPLFDAILPWSNEFLANIGINDLFNSLANAIPEFPSEAIAPGSEMAQAPTTPAPTPPVTGAEPTVPAPNNTPVPQPPEDGLGFDSFG